MVVPPPVPAFKGMVIGWGLILSTKSVPQFMPGSREYREAP